MPDPHAEAFTAEIALRLEQHLARPARRWDKNTDFDWVDPTSGYKKIVLTGVAGQANSYITKTFGDGTEVRYAWNATRSHYESTDGDGANDCFSQSGATWTWTNGSSRAKEDYLDVAGVLRIRFSRDADGNTVTYNFARLQPNASTPPVSSEQVREEAVKLQREFFDVLRQSETNLLAKADAGSRECPSEQTARLQKDLPVLIRRNSRRFWGGSDADFDAQLGSVVRKAIDWRREMASSSKHDSCAATARAAHEVLRLFADRTRRYADVKWDAGVPNRERLREGAFFLWQLSHALELPDDPERRSETIDRHMR